MTDVKKTFSCLKKENFLLLEKKENFLLLEKRKLSLALGNIEISCRDSDVVPVFFTSVQHPYINPTILYLHAEGVAHPYI